MPGAYRSRASEAQRRAVQRGAKRQQLRPVICFDCGRPYVPGSGHFTGPLWVCCTCLGPIHEDRDALIARGFEPYACSPPPPPAVPPGRKELSWAMLAVVGLFWFWLLLALLRLIFHPPW